MKQSILLIKFMLVAGLTSCASDLPEAPKMTEETAAAQGPQELPAALRRVGYDAPDFGDQLPPELVSSSSTLPARSAYLTGESASTDAARTKEVPSAPRQVRGSYQPRADLSEFDPDIITAGRAPRAAGAPATRAPIEVAPPRPVTRASAEPDPSVDDFKGRTQSIMSNATPTPPRATRSGQYGIHLASYRDAANLPKGWDVLRRQHADMLTSLQARGANVTLPGKGDYIRLIVGPFASPSDARALCAHLQSLDEYCQVMPFDGVPIL